MSLAAIIKHRILSDGPISFREFMEMALYYPQLGYYTSAGKKIGPDGDFYTSCNITSLYGMMMARQIEEMWRYIGDDEFTIVEFGAGSGMLCNDILHYLRQNERLYSALSYCIIEKSPAMRDKEQFLKCGKVSLHDSIDSLSKITGCIISNELIDNFAVHKVLMADELMEVYVDYRDNFVEVLRPAPASLQAYFDELGISLPKGQCAEVNIEAAEWITDISRWLQKGYVITVDYGYPSADLYDKKRASGTLACYYKHHVHFDLFSNIGHQDITSHVNFSALSHWGQLNGLESVGFTSQAHFLLGLGIREELTKQLLSGVPDAYNSYKKNASIVHHLLNDMGAKFNVLIQQKNAPRLPLSGLRLAAPDSVYKLKTEHKYAWAAIPKEQTST